MEITRTMTALTEAAFHRLLAQLDADPERAGEVYEELRSMLIKFFKWRRASFPEERADETFNRVARNMEEGVKVQDVANYCYGVARLLLLETLRGPESRRAAIDDLPPLAAGTDETEERERQFVCFELCLRQLPAESRELVIQYYQEERQARIDHRRALAERLGIPLNALRSRTMRIRDKLERCVERCRRKPS